MIKKHNSNTIWEVKIPGKSIYDGTSFSEITEKVAPPKMFS